MSLMDLDFVQRSLLHRDYSSQALRFSDSINLLCRLEVFWTASIYMDEQLLLSLEQRVDQLERDLGLPLPKQDPPVAESIARLERDIEALGLSALNPELVDKYHKLKALLDCADTRKALSHTLRKAEILMKSAQDMRQAAKQLEEIQRLKRFLDFDPLHSKR